MIVLDTNAFIWAFMGVGRLGERSRAAIEEARAGDGVAVSPITIWEISMLADKDRLHLGEDVMVWISAALAAPRVNLAPISAEIGVDAGRLPGSIHGDPADRVIIATARALRCPLLTSDGRILAYAQQGFVKAIDARL